MKRFFTTILLVLLFCTSKNSSADTSPHRAGEVIVMIKASYSIEAIIAHNKELLGVQTNLHVKEIIAKKSGIYLLSFDATTIDEETFLKQVKSTTGVAIAQFNHFIETRGLPDDVQFTTQYALHNTGQSSGTIDADIDALEAWDITTGGVSVLGDTIVVAVIDDGFQLTHPDLSFWINNNEIASNGIDDDGNGFIDDVKGWNVFSHNGNIVNAQHGTHVAGIIGAKGNNAMGVSGVNWNVKLMPVVGATQLESQAIEAYSYVLECRRLYNETNGDKGAFVVASNSSFGVNMGQPSNFPLWCAYYDSLGKVGVLNAAATANNNWNIDVVGDIPCACNSEYLITVSCTGRNDTKVLNAAYGVNTIDMGAPGHLIISTYPTSTYATLTGTSMASPHVAGSIALTYAAACQYFMQDYKLYPDSVSLLMRDFIIHSVDLKQGFDTLFVMGGRLNVFNAINEAQIYGNCSSIGLTELSKDVNAFEIQSIYPNPSTNDIHLQCSATTFPFTIELRDVLGRLVKEVYVNKSVSNTSYTINCKELSNAVYYVRLKNTHSYSTSKRFVKID
jgi:serine protease